MRSGCDVALCSECFCVHTLMEQVYNALYLGFFDERFALIILILSVTSIVILTSFKTVITLGVVIVHDHKENNTYSFLTLKLRG